MSLRATLLLGSAAVLAWLALLLGTEQWGFGAAPAGGPRWRFLLEDAYDVNIYQQRGRWLPAGRAPYVEEHSEYPQLATLLFGVPYLFFDSHVPAGRAQTVQELLAHPEDTAAYRDLHHVLMAVSLLALLACTARLLVELRAPPALALLLLLPGTLYYAFNRFDAWPAACVAAALLAHLRGRRALAGLCLGLGAMFKWYPILLLPLLLSHAVFGRGDVRPLRARLAAALPGPCLAAGLACGALLALTWAWPDCQGRPGGLAAVLHPYEFHGGRVPNASSVVFALSQPWRWGLFGTEDVGALGTASTLMQLLPALLLGLVPVRNRRALVLGCLAVVLAFMLFGKVWSPQWICWVTPLALLAAARSRVALALLVAAELLVYVQVPVLYHESLAGADAARRSPAFWLACDARIACLLAFWAWSVAAFLRTVGRAEDPPAPDRAAAAAG